MKTFEQYLNEDGQEEHGFITNPTVEQQKQILEAGDNMYSWIKDNIPEAQQPEKIMKDWWAVIAMNRGQTDKHWWLKQRN
jgi:hypothetical protein